MCREDIGADRELGVGRVDEDHIVNAMLRYAKQNLVDEIAVGIEHSEANTLLEVLGDEIQKERALARARCSDDMRMPEPHLRTHAHVSLDSLVDVLAEDERMSFRHGGS